MYCSDITPPLYLFFSSNVPALLYYSHIPAFVVALLLGGFLFLKNRHNLAIKLLLIVNLLFGTLVILNLILWTNTDIRLITFAWPLSQLVYIAIPIVSLYLFYVFSTKKDAPYAFKLIWFVMLLAASMLAFSQLNILYFDVTLCEVVTSDFVAIYQNIVFGIIFLWLLVLGFIRIRGTKSPKERGQVSLFFAGLLIFLAMLVFTWQIATELGLFELEQYGLFGMVIFMAVMAYLIVHYQTFNVGLIAAQALVAALLILIAAEFTFVQTTTSRVLISTTLLLTAVLGFLLIRNVKKEIALRKHIEELARNLEISNKQQVVLIHFITHQIKGFVTKSRNIFATLLDGDYGVIPETIKPMMEEGLRSDTKGVSTIQEILNAANIKSGKVAYTKEPFDLKALVDEIATDLKGSADAKGLSLVVETGTEPMMYPGDRAQLVNALKNLIDNSIKYTPKGKVSVSLAKEDKKIRFVVTDTGVGISAEDMAHLFTEGGHGKNSASINVESTGFGLYIVKNIIEAHEGRVWAESEGEGKGSRFIVELPV